MTTNRNNQIASGIASATTGSVFYPSRSSGDAVGLLQVEITGTATVQLQGRLSPDASWVNLLETSMTASGMVAVVLPPQVRINVSSYSGGAVSAWLQE